MSRDLADRSMPPAGDGGVPGTVSGVSKSLLAYRVMANVVGVLLIVLVLIGVPLANFDGTSMWHVFDSTPEIWAQGTTAHDVGEFITTVLGIAHGWLYMIFLITAFSLSRRAGWSLGFTLATLALGTVPILSFWSERRATRKVRSEHPELAARTT